MASNLTAVRRRLFGSPSRASRAPKPYDGMTKAELYARVELLFGRISKAKKLAADYARDCHHSKDTVNRERFHGVEAALDLSREGT